jgi:tyrosine-protein kinase Etk/Wzc
MQVEREQLRRDRDAIERVLAQEADSGLAQGLEVVGTVQGSAALATALHELTLKQADLRAIRYHYTDEYPGAKRLVTAIETLERRTIPTLARGLLAEIATREDVIDTLVQSAGHQLKQIPQRAVEEARLRREVAIAENLYTTLQQRYEEARLAEASTIPDVRVLDAAVAPQWPIKNTMSRFILVGLFGGLGLSVLGVVLMDRFDSRIRYPQQVTSELGLPILGAVPHLGKGRREARPDDVTQVIEALRTVRLNVATAYGAAGPVLLTITSPGPGDGKSFVSGNLARAFADSGRKTLLIDGDARRGVLHRVLKLSRRPGLIDYLSGDMPFERIVQATDHRLLSFIGSGSRAGDAPELLGTPAMAHLLAAARIAYQVVLVDSPQLGAGIDPLVLGPLTGSLVIVLRNGATDRQMTHVKLEGIERLPIRVLGAVLNDVQPGGVYKYYSYLSGYAATLTICKVVQPN